MDCLEIPRNGDRQEMMIRQETGGKRSGVSQWGTPCSASAFAFICSLDCAAHLSSPRMARLEYYKACAEKKSDSRQNNSLSAFRRCSDMHVCLCAGPGLSDRSVRLRHLNSWELHPAIPLLQWLLGLRRFSIFPDWHSLGIWLSNQRGPAAFLIYDLESQHSAGPIHHLHPGFFVVFTPPSCLMKDLLLSPPPCLLIILPERSQLN